MLAQLKARVRELNTLADEVFILAERFGKEDATAQPDLAIKGQQWFRGRQPSPPVIVISTSLQSRAGPSKSSRANGSHPEVRPEPLWSGIAPPWSLKTGQTFI